MSEYKEFKAKDLDQAIDAACKHFKVDRGKLEIEIVSGGSSGIFGLVGKKQATVRARLRQPSTGKSVLEAPLDKPAPQASPDKPEREPKAAKAPRPPRGKKPASEAAQAAGQADGQEPEQAEAAPKQEASEQADKPKRSRRSRGRRSRGRGKGNGNGAQAEGAEAAEAAEAAPEARRESRAPAKRDKAMPPARREQAQPPARREPAQPPAKTEPASEAESLPGPSQEEINAMAKEVVARLIGPMLPTLPPLDVESEPGRIKVHIVDEEHSGLIIGHQGQTIAALQYLANRIMARKARGNIRIHLDAGDYREKQDDSLRQLALSLADKAKSQGKMQSTRPLSSYHRRLVHLALQNDDSITTRSKGEGPMKRVLILPRRENRQQQ